MGGGASTNHSHILQKNSSNDNSNEFTVGDATDASISGLSTVPPWMKALQLAEQSKKDLPSLQTEPNSNGRVLIPVDNSSNVKLQVLRVPVFEKHPTTDFRLLHKLGMGSFSTVYKAELKQNNFIRLAIKEIDMDRLQKRKLLSLGREMNILSQLRHPTIVDLFGVYKTPTKVYLIMEYLKGGELMASIAQRSDFKESDARRVMSQLVHALQYMHKKKVVHRDIKPANLILVHRGLESPVKIVDFGFATIESDHVPDDDNHSSSQSTTSTTPTILCGTPGFLAPEVILSRSYTCKVDIWCLGVVFYILLSGMMPFTADPTGEIRTLNGEYSFPNSAFNTVSSSAKDLIRRMLQLKPSNRITATEILSHPWMKRKNISTQRLKPRPANYYIDNGSYGYTNNDKQALHAVGSDAHYGFYEVDEQNETAVKEDDDDNEADDDVDITQNLRSLRLYYAASAAPSPEKDAVLGIRQQHSTLSQQQPRHEKEEEEEREEREPFRVHLPSESDHQQEQQNAHLIIAAPPPFSPKITPNPLIILPPAAEVSSNKVIRRVSLDDLAASNVPVATNAAAAEAEIAADADATVVGPSGLVEEGADSASSGF
jgi:serine/threonine protein kinase